MTRDQMRRLLTELGHPPDESSEAVGPDHLRALGIEPESDLGWFYRTCAPCLLDCPRAVEDLLDVIEPQVPGLPAIGPWDMPVGSATIYVREGWGVSDEFLCLSTVDADGAFLYHLPTGRVYDFTRGQYDALNSGELPPRWGSLFEFLEWYLTCGT